MNYPLMNYLLLQQKSHVSWSYLGMSVIWETHDTDTYHVYELSSVWELEEIVGRGTSNAILLADDTRCYD